MQQQGQDSLLSFAATSNAQRFQGDKIYKEIQSQKPNGKGSDSLGCKQHAPKKVRKRANCGFQDFEKFPSFEPIIRGGNDGLPFNVDNLAIPKGKWRNESIKSYGNAWVPQVAYEIFRAIQINNTCYG